MKPLKVGQKNPISNKLISYYHIPNVYNKMWIDSNFYLPLDYDLVEVKIDEKIKKGWHALGKWDGLYFPKNAIVNFWRKIIT